jgi:hypothetical protein
LNRSLIHMKRSREKERGSKILLSMDRCFWRF